MNLYKYYFNNMPKPISIEAYAKVDAVAKLEVICNDPKYRDAGYAMNNLVKETVESLIIGVSTKNIKDVPHVWSAQGWVKNL